MWSQQGLVRRLMALQAHNLCEVDKEGSGQEAIRSKEGASRR